MLNDKQTARMLAKLRRFEETLEPMLFQPVAQLPAEAFRTSEILYEIPPREKFSPIASGDHWGGEGNCCWIRSEFTVPPELAGKPLYLQPRMGGYEALLWVDGEPFGTFATKIVVTGHGNHYCDMVVRSPKAGQKVELALEFYAGHFVRGCAPLSEEGRTDYDFVFESLTLCVKNQLISDFLFDLRTLNELVETLDETSYRRAEVIRTLTALHRILYYDPTSVEPETFTQALMRGRTIMAPSLARKNSSTAPTVGIVGHSHMDTAWLWPVRETIKKCARTYSNQLNLKQQYPEYRFIQSSAYHSEMIRRHYPGLFKKIQQAVAEGWYEPNGGVWVECDCNITSGEAMVRQFLWGQRYTRQYFGYTSNCFWLPDTFGYSAAIPQIMKGCGVDYFLTTKMAWNDTNQFPYDTFYWEGLDGTRVLTHLNKTHVWPSPADFAPLVYGTESPDAVRQKQVSDRKLIAYGFGDGGGGPQFEMIEMACRCLDLEGCPKAAHTSVGQFMKELEGAIHDPATYSGELYLELHRGTLTNQHTIKRHNRLSEIALHDLELFTVRQAMAEGKAASDEAYRSLWETLLVNQFHDILPGTCIPAAHQTSIAETTVLLVEAGQQMEKLLGQDENLPTITVSNTTSFDREDVIYLDVPAGWRVAGGYPQQRVNRLNEGEQLAVAGVKIPPLSSVTLTLEPGDPTGVSPFRLDEHRLETPFAQVTFNSRRFISSFVDVAAGRELVGEGYPFGTFLMAEDLPLNYDNWDVDADLELKYRDCAQLLSWEVVSDGPVELRIRHRYTLSGKSQLTQDVVFSAFSPLVTYETRMDWQDDHRFLKTAFDTSIFADTVRQEVQFGCLKRPTTRNTTLEQARFEVLNHKYTDLSEPRYGVSILNDCKYGISARGGQLRLSLHKGGLRPDDTGDHGVHCCTYGFLPHMGGFSAETVIQPAYLFNYHHRAVRGGIALDSLLTLTAPNIVVEAVKPCEDGERACIVRLYEAEGSFTHCGVQLDPAFHGAALTNLLEEEQQSLSVEDLSLTFRPFEIKTLKLCY